MLYELENDRRNVSCKLTVKFEIPTENAYAHWRKTIRSSLTLETSRKVVEDPRSASMFSKNALSDTIHSQTVFGQWYVRISASEGPSITRFDHRRSRDSSTHGATNARQVATRKSQKPERQTMLRDAWLYGDCERRTIRRALNEARRETTGD